MLQERADRIKERELRRKANIKRKEERNQREREARQRMGIPSPVKDGNKMRVGPSQLHLGDILGMGKRKRDEETVEKENAPFEDVENENLVGASSKGCHVSPRPWRNPLQIISAHSRCLSRPLSGTAKLGGSRANEKSPQAQAEGTKVPQPSRFPSQATSTSPTIEQHTLRETKVDGIEANEGIGSIGRKNLPMGPPPSCTPAQPKSPISTVEEQPLAENKEGEKPEEEEAECTEYQTVSMGPPPLPKLFATRCTNTTAQQKSLLFTPQHRPPDIVEDSWDDFFVSNTQIGRELSPPPVKKIPMLPPVAEPGLSGEAFSPPPLQRKGSTADILDLICTQDLDFSGGFTQAMPVIMEESSNTASLLAHISTQDLDFSGDSTQVTPNAATSSFESSSVNSSTELDTEAVPSPATTESFDFDEDVTEGDLQPTQAVPAKATESFDFSEDVTEEDLEELVLEFELESTGHSYHKSPVRQESVEEARLGAECDAFDLSTQDLRELES